MQFTLKRLLLSILLIAFGTAVWTVGMWLMRYPAENFFVMNLALCFTGSAFVGAGLFYLFRRAGLGAVVGVCVQVLALFALGFRTT